MAKNTIYSSWTKRTLRHNLLSCKYYCVSWNGMPRETERVERNWDAACCKKIWGIISPLYFIVVVVVNSLSHRQRSNTRTHLYIYCMDSVRPYIDSHLLIFYSSNSLNWKTMFFVILVVVCCWCSFHHFIIIKLKWYKQNVWKSFFSI